MDVGENQVVIPPGVDSVQTYRGCFSFVGARDGEDGVWVGVAFEEVDGAEVMGRHDTDLDGYGGHCWLQSGAGDVVLIALWEELPQRVGWDEDFF